MFPPTPITTELADATEPEAGVVAAEAALGEEALGFVHLHSHRSFEHLYGLQLMDTPPPFAQMIKNLLFLQNLDRLSLAAAAQGPASQMLMTSKGHFPFAVYIYWGFFCGGEVGPRPMSPDSGTPADRAAIVRNNVDLCGSEKDSSGESLGSNNAVAQK